MARSVFTPRLIYARGSLRLSRGFKLIGMAYEKSRSLEIKSMQVLIISAAKFFYLVCLL
jgi:hypothetical protein